ncbi:TadE family type IV pilus minor pilin [Mycetocola spongiae]|uniref:TadE family type IV pilus minor pilin n=1 Tax=Mycetocola spongiae TaxID=2859226 RepID=UPI001CF34E90|nr:TadE family type IV pilus minor pilin [Mycetocola spongiae]UCR87853.1 hypothetical protein KXZ72_07405 [Mycetocola spongiae]
MVLPAVVLCCLFLLGAIGAAGQRVRLIDAAGQAARELSRGESLDTVEPRLTRLIGPASLTTAQEGEYICVRLSAPVALAGALGLGLSQHVESCALDAGS